MSIRNLQLSEKEEEKLLEFKRYVAEKHATVRKQLWDNYFLLKFCRNDHELKIVKKKFDNFIVNYKEYDLDNMIEIHREESENYNHFLKNTSKHEVFSKNYEAVSIEFCQFQNSYELVKIPYKSYVHHFVRLYIEYIKVRFPILSKKAGKRIDRFNVVMDLTGFAMSQYLDSKVRNYFIGLVKILQDTFPEMLVRVVMINPPLLFNGLSAICKPFIPKKTMDKVQILRGADVNLFMQNWIDKDMLPEAYGGNLKIDHSKHFDWAENYLKECYKKGTYILEDGIYDEEKGIYPPDDPLERAKTINPNYKPTDLNTIIKEQKNSNTMDSSFDILQEEFRLTDEEITKIHIPSSKNLHILKG